MSVGSDPDMVFHTSAVSANYLRKARRNIAADVIGVSVRPDERMARQSRGWRGSPRVTHSHRPTGSIQKRPFTFVTDGVQSAGPSRTCLRWREAASVSAENLAGQPFRAGLIDEVRIDLIPVAIGSVIRYFGDL